MDIHAYHLNKSFIGMDSWDLILIVSPEVV